MAAVIQPRKHRHRTIFLVLFALFSFVTYLCIFQQTAVSTTFALKRGDAPTGQIGLALESLRHSHSRHTRPLSSHHPTLKLGKNEELAAVSSFIASLPQNVIPSFVDPANPIDPHLVIDFDTRSPRATEEVKQMVEDVWTRNPVFLYSRLYSPKSREVKALLAGLHLKPAPTIIDVDIREDAEVLEPLVQRLTSVDELPVLLVGGKPVGDMATIRSLYESGDLQQMITDAGAVIDGAKKKHKKK